MNEVIEQRIDELKSEFEVFEVEHAVIEEEYNSDLELEFAICEMSVIGITGEVHPTDFPDWEFDKSHIGTDSAPRWVLTTRYVP